MDGSPIGVAGDGRPETLTAGRVLDFSGNDYLGLSRDRDVQRAAAQALVDHGVGARSVRGVGRDVGLLEQLEAAIAEFERASAAVVTQSGYTANTSLIPSLVGDGDLVVYDAYAHPSIVDGARLSNAECVAFEHLDVEHLERTLQRARQKMPRDRSIVVATDGVFGTDGEIAPVPALAELAERFETVLVVDDAHATGILGATGSGTPEHFGVRSPAMIKTGTMSKALGGAGGFVAGAEHVTTRMLRKGHAILYSTAAPPAMLAAALEALARLRAEPERVARLRANSALFRTRLAEAGFRLGSGEAAIVAIFAPDMESVRTADVRLRADGILVRSVLPPRVRPEHACIRMMMNSEHSQDELEAGIEGVLRVGEAVGLVH